MPVIFFLFHLFLYCTETLYRFWCNSQSGYFQKEIQDILYKSSETTLAELAGEEETVALVITQSFISSHSCLNQPILSD